MRSGWGGRWINDAGAPAGAVDPPISSFWQPQDYAACCSFCTCLLVFMTHLGLPCTRKSALPNKRSASHLPPRQSQHGPKPWPLPLVGARSTCLRYFVMLAGTIMHALSCLHLTHVHMVANTRQWGFRHQHAARCLAWQGCSTLYRCRSANLLCLHAGVCTWYSPDCSSTGGSASRADHHRRQHLVERTQQPCRGCS